MKFWGIGFLLLILGSSVFGQDEVRITQRFDVRKKINNQYVGLVYGYEMGVWKFSPGEKSDRWVDATYYKMQESRRDNAMLEKPLDQTTQVRFRLSEKGTMSEFSSSAAPYYRNYPQRPPLDAQVGDVWVGNAELASDFLSDGKTTRIPILIEYKWKGEGTLLDQSVWVVTAKYAVRYKAGADAQGDPDLSHAEGTHDAVIYFKKENFAPMMVRETTKEQFSSASGKTVQNEGIILTFYEGVPALDTATQTQKIAEDLAKSPATSQDVKVSEDPRGVKLTLENLRFVADQAVLLPGESERLDRIAAALKKVPDRSFLVVGHTADVGTQESQKSLSEKRSLAMVEELKKRGIEPRKLLFQGVGGTQPIATNQSEEGRAQNRRVEIIILDQ